MILFARSTLVFDLIYNSGHIIDAWTFETRCIERRQRIAWRLSGRSAASYSEIAKRKRRVPFLGPGQKRWKWNERRQAAGDILSDFIYVARQQRYPIFPWKIGKTLFP